MVLVSGSSVVSVWKGLPSTLPLKTTERRRLIGNSGLVILVGFENFGASMSSRLLSGATGSLSRPAATSCARVGCGIVPRSSLSSLHAVIVSAAPMAAIVVSRIRLFYDRPMRRS